MSHLTFGEIARVAIRAPAAIVWTLSVHWLARLRQLALRGQWIDRSYKDLIGVWGAGLAWIMGVRLVKRNERTGPMGDLIIANHMGFLDIPVLLCTYPSVFIMTMQYRRFFYLGKALSRQGHVFVERRNSRSRQHARDGVRRVLERGERIIVFPEGRSTPGAKRLPFKPFCFHEVARQGKRIEACVIDYLPDRSMLEWDNSRPILPQVVKLLGRRRTEVSVEFLPSEVIADPNEAVRRYHDVIEEKLLSYDAERNQGKAHSVESFGRDLAHETP
jgi:1-acyl-sn-glycerol-3-phosphate acyltransferase